MKLHELVSQLQNKGSERRVGGMLDEQELEALRERCEDIAHEEEVLSRRALEAEKLFSERGVALAPCRVQERSGKELFDLTIQQIELWRQALLERLSNLRSLGGLLRVNEMLSSFLFETRRDPFRQRTEVVVKYYGSTTYELVTFSVDDLLLRLERQ